MVDPSRPWDRRPGEGDVAWDAFRKFLVRRDTQAVADMIGRSVRTIRNYSSAHDWAERALAWDAEQARAEDAAIIDERVKLAREHLEHWGRLRKLAMNEATRLINEAHRRGADGEPGVVGAREVVRIMDLATKNERLIVGEVTERTETTGSEWDLSKLNDEELAILRELQRKAAR